ncbi:MAG: molybdopterin-guanine dinucleotide biosynthesis protein B [Pseudomonadota bacterium]
MILWGITGWKNSGKTTLTARLVAEMGRRGLRVSTLKHTHHGIDLDRPGKDTFRHREAGAVEVVLASSARMAILREHREGEPPLAEVLARLAPVDLVLIEGYKASAHPKIEVRRAAAPGPPLADGDPSVRAIAADGPVESALPVFALDDARGIADFILAETGLA